MWCRVSVLSSVANKRWRLEEILRILVTTTTACKNRRLDSWRSCDSSPPLLLLLVQHISRCSRGRKLKNSIRETTTSLRTIAARQRDDSISGEQRCEIYLAISEQWTSKKEAKNVNNERLPKPKAVVSSAEQFHRWFTHVFAKEATRWAWEAWQVWFPDQT